MLACLLLFTIGVNIIILTFASSAIGVERTGNTSPVRGGGRYRPYEKTVSLYIEISYYLSKIMIFFSTYMQKPNITFNVKTGDTLYY